MNKRQRKKYNRRSARRMAYDAMRILKLQPPSLDTLDESVAKLNSVLDQWHYDFLQQELTRRGVLPHQD